jgi:CRP-like cAMP-binding protein
MLRYTHSLNIDLPTLCEFELHEDVDQPSAISPSIRDRPFLFAGACPANPLIMRLEQFTRFDNQEIAALVALSASPRIYPSGHILINDCTCVEHVFLLLEGMAYRYKILPSGKRQILGYLVPGDLFDLQFDPASRPDHSIALLCKSTVVKIPIRRMDHLLSQFPHVERALTVATLLDVAILREWLLNIGQRNAIQKVSHFFCEMMVRLSKVGQVDADGSFDLPVNQMMLADTTGLTSVHINRTLQRLRGLGLIILKHRRLSILNFNHLAAVADFEGSYLRCRTFARGVAYD